MQIKKEWMILFIIGFLFGIITYIGGGNTYLSGNGIFSKYFLSSFGASSVVSAKYLTYVVLVRLIPVIFIMIISYSRLHRIIIDFSLAWTGFSNGMILSSAMILMGWRGILLFLTAYFPQIICYLPVYFLLLIQCELHQNQKWTLSKYVFLFLVLMMGIILEAAVNPYVLSFCLKKL